MFTYMASPTVLFFVFFSFCFRFAMHALWAPPLNEERNSRAASFEKDGAQPLALKLHCFCVAQMHHILQAQSQPTHRHATLVYLQCPNLVRGPLRQDAITLVTWIQLCVQTGDVAREPRQGGRLCTSF